VTETLSAIDVVERTRQPILEFARGWLMSPDTAAKGAELGLPKGFGFWVCGRGGVVGDVDSDVAAAAIGFMAPPVVRSIWEARPAGLAARDCAAAYAECCFAWGRVALADVPEARLERLDALARAVADAAPAVTGALFAGWRAMPRPADAAARVALSMHVLRELRGGAHLSAIQASGLSPVGSIMASPAPRGGADWAGALGWSEPYPDAAGLGEARQAAEALTSKICAPAYEVLDPIERADFVELVATARAAID